MILQFILKERAIRLTVFLSCNELVKRLVNLVGKGVELD